MKGGNRNDKVGGLSFGPAGLWGSGARGICFSPPGSYDAPPGEGSLRGLGVLKEKAACGLGEYVFPSHGVRVAQASLSTPAVPRLSKEQTASLTPSLNPQQAIDRFGKKSLTSGRII